MKRRGRPKGSKKTTKTTVEKSQLLTEYNSNKIKTDLNNLLKTSVGTPSELDALIVTTHVGYLLAILDSPFSLTSPKTRQDTTLSS